MRVTVQHFRVLILCMLVASACCAVLTAQPTTSNWEEQGGTNWHVGGDLDIESGGEIDVESGGRVDVESGATLDVATGSTFTVGTTITASSHFELTGTSVSVSTTIVDGTLSTAVTGLALGDSDYYVVAEPTANVTIQAVTNKTDTGFTLIHDEIGGTDNLALRLLVVHF